MGCGALSDYGSGKLTEKWGQKEWTNSDRHGNDSSSFSVPIFLSAFLPSFSIKKDSIRHEPQLRRFSEQSEHFASETILLRKIIAVNRLPAAGDTADDGDSARCDQAGDVRDVADVSQNSGDHQAETLVAIRLAGDVTG